MPLGSRSYQRKAVRPIEGGEIDRASPRGALSAVLPPEHDKHGPGAFQGGRV